MAHYWYLNDFLLLVVLVMLLLLSQVLRGQLWGKSQQKHQPKAEGGVPLVSFLPSPCHVVPSYLSTTTTTKELQRGLRAFFKKLARLDVAST